MRIPPLSARDRIVMAQTARRAVVTFSDRPAVAAFFLAVVDALERDTQSVAWRPPPDALANEADRIVDYVLAAVGAVHAAHRRQFGAGADAWHQLGVELAELRDARRLERRRSDRIIESMHGGNRVA